MATQSLVAELRTLAELHESGALTEGEFSLAKTHLLGEAAAAAVPTPEQPPGAGSSLVAVVAPVKGAGSSPLRVTRGSELLPVLAAAVSGAPTAGASSARSAGEVAPPPLFAPSAAAIEQAVAELASVLTGDDELARLAALRSMQTDSRTLRNALSGSGDDRLCEELVRCVGAVLRVTSSRSSHRLAASLLVVCGSAVPEGSNSSALSSATWNWVGAVDSF